MEEDTIIATLHLSLEEVDVVLNALEEKAINVRKLRQNIFNNVNEQVKVMQQQVVDNNDSNIKNKKGKNKK